MTYWYGFLHVYADSSSLLSIRTAYSDYVSEPDASNRKYSTALSAVLNSFDEELTSRVSVQKVSEYYSGCKSLTIMINGVGIPNRMIAESLATLVSGVVEMEFTLLGEETVHWQYSRRKLDDFRQ